MLILWNICQILEYTREYCDKELLEVFSMSIDRINGFGIDVPECCGDISSASSETDLSLFEKAKFEVLVASMKDDTSSNLRNLLIKDLVKPKKNLDKVTVDEYWKERTFIARLYFMHPIYTVILIRASCSSLDDLYSKSEESWAKLEPLFRSILDTKFKKASGVPYI